MVHGYKRMQRMHINIRAAFENQNNIATNVKQNIFQKR